MTTVIVTPTTVTGTGVTQEVYRHRLADELGFYQSTTVASTAAGGDPTRVLLSNDLRDDEEGYEFLHDPWVYVRTGDQARTQRRILRQPGVGYQGQQSAIVVSRPFAAAVTTASALEITSPLPVRRHLGIKGLNECIDEALGLIPVIARLTIAGNGTYSYDLAGVLGDDLVIYNQIQNVLDTTQLGQSFPPTPSPYPVSIVTNGVDRSLQTQWLYGTDTTFYVDIIVRADRLVFDTASWAFAAQNGTLGLQSDDWQAAAPIGWVLPFAMVRALSFLNRMIRADRQLDPAERADALAENLRLRQHWARTANVVSRTQFPKPQQAPSDPTIAAWAVPSWP